MKLFKSALLLFVLLLSACGASSQTSPPIAVTTTSVASYDIHKLLPTGSTAKVYTHVMCWWGSPQHPDIGYDSANPVTIHKQYLLMQAVGLNGIFIDWYGKENTHTDLCTQNWILEANTHPGFTVGIVIDKGAVNWTTDKTAGVLTELAYIKANYESQPSFYKSYIQDFGLTSVVNWATVAVQFPEFQYCHQNSCFTWVENGNGGADGVLARYNSTPSIKFGSVTARFFDGCLTNYNASVWNCSGTIKPVRVMEGFNTGVNFLKGFRYVPLWLPNVILVTWNDYQEGTSLEGFYSELLGMSIR